MGPAMPHDRSRTLSPSSTAPGMRSALQTEGAQRVLARDLAAIRLRDAGLAELLRDDLAGVRPAGGWVREIRRPVQAVGTEVLVGRGQAVGLVHEGRAHLPLEVLARQE